MVTIADKYYGKGGLKLTDELEEQIRTDFLEYVEKGALVKDAMVLVGIDPGKLKQWKKKDPVFREGYERAQLASKQRNIALIQEAGKTKWQAAAWFLERRYPEDYSLKKGLEGLNSGDSLTLILNKVINYGEKDPSKVYVQDEEKLLPEEGN